MWKNLQSNKDRKHTFVSWFALNKTQNEWSQAFDGGIYCEPSESDI